MNHIQLLGLSLGGQPGGVERGVSSAPAQGASEGFQDVFNKVSQPKSDAAGDFLSRSDLNQKVSEEDSEALEDLHQDHEDFESLDEVIKDEERDSFLDDEVSVEDTLEKFKDFQEELSLEEEQVLIERVKELLKDPEVAQEIVKVLEESGVDLANISEASLKEALASLPRGAHEKLVKLLQLETLNPTPLTLSQIIGEALNQLKDEGPAETGIKNTPRELSEEFSEGGSDDPLNEFLKKVRVTEIEAKDDRQLQEHKLVEADPETLKKVGRTIQLSAASGQVAQGPESLADSLAAAASPIRAASVSTTLNLANSSVDSSNQVTLGEGKNAKDLKNAKLAAAPTTPRSNLSTEVERAQIMKRIMARAMMHKEGGEVKFSIRMEPSELGNVRVSFHQNSEGTLNALIVAENETARQTLQANVPELKISLAEQNVNVDRVEVTVGDKESGANREHLNQERQRRREETARRIAATDRRQEKLEEEKNLQEEEDVLLDDSQILSMTA